MVISSKDVKWKLRVSDSNLLTLIRDGRMKGEQDERSEALLVLVEREDVRLVDFALNVAKELAPANILKFKVTSAF